MNNTPEQTSGVDTSVGTTGIEQRFEISADCSREEFLAIARVYAREIVSLFNLSVNVSGLDWEVSMRAKRRAGVLYYQNGQPHSIKLAWKQFESAGWYETASTIRHELIHAHLLNEASDPDHSESFKKLANELATHVHCNRFSDPKWWVICRSCGQRMPRYRRSSLVKNPSQFECSACGGSLTVEENLNE